MPLVSVITPFHRVLPYLRETVESVRAQTLTDWELLLVDNGTGAGLAAIGEAARDPRVRLVTLGANLGASGGRNHGIAAARAEFIALLDYDDLCRPTRLEKQVARLRAEPGLGLVAGGSELIDETGRVTGPDFTLGGTREQLVFSAYTMPGAISSYTGRREVFEREPFRAEFQGAEDFDFLSRAAEHCAVGCVPEPLLGYRTYGDQTSRRHRRRQIFDANVVRLMTARRRSGRAEDLPGLKAEFAAWFADAPAPEVSCLRFADRALEENLPLLGVYLARRHVSYARRAGALGRAARRFARALRIAPGQAALLAAMFFGGPLRAHRLRPIQLAGTGTPAVAR